MAGKCGVILQGFDKERVDEARRVLQRLLELGPGQANDILESSPIVLFDGLKKAICDVIVEKLSELAKAGVEIESVSRVPVHLPRIDWPEPLPIVLEAEKEVESAKGEKAVTAESEKKPPVEEKSEEAKKGLELKKETKVEGRVVVPKYEFVVDERNIFTCPACGAMFLLKSVSREEAQEARAQEEIKRLLEVKDETVEEVAEAGVDEEEGSTIEGIVSDEDALIVEEPSNEEEPLAVPFSSKDVEPRVKISNEFLDIAEFEKGFKEKTTEETAKEEEKEEYAEAEETEEATAEEEEKEVESVSSEGTGYGEALINELEKLPEEKSPAVLEGVAKQEEEVKEEAEEEKKTEEVEESGSEELPPDELLRYVEEQKKKKEREKLLAARAARRVAPIPQDEKQEKASQTTTPEAAPVAKGTEEEPATEPIGGEEKGNYGVVVSRVETTEKRRKAAQIMEDELGIPIEQGMRICSGGIIINVAKGLSKDKAAALYQRFKSAGIMARITEHKKHRRR
jgi:hypothetical protein